MKYLFFPILFFISAKSYASSDIDGYCQTKLRIMDFKSLDVQNCGLAKALVNTPEVIEYQREKINQKLSLKLANQIDQNIEEMATLDQFYSMNNQDLMMADNDVKKECRIDHIKSLEINCTGSNLNILKSAFKIQGGTLYKHITDKFTSARIDGKAGANQCPIQDSTGVFKLESQLDSKSAIALINLIKNADKTTPELYSRWIDQYPQFKLIDRNSDNHFKDLFKTYLAKFTGSPDGAKNYITQFFFKAENQKILAKGLAAQCDKINKNIEKFLCKNLDQLGSLDEKASKDLFALDPKINMENKWDLPDVSTPQGETFYTAYGFQCLARENLNKAGNLTNSVDQWYRDFNENTRPIKMAAKVNNIKTAFCSMYNCSDNESKKTSSCKNGGPISSVDLITKYGCPDSKECSIEVLKYISFIETIEKERPNFSKLAYNNGSENLLANQNKTIRYSSFAENFLGVEGTLWAEGKQITPITLAQKTNEFLERKLDPTPPLHESNNDNKPSVISSTRSLNDANGVIGEQFAANSSKALAASRFDQLANNDENFQPIKKTIAVKKFSTVDKAPNSNVSSANEDRDAELKKLRADLESVSKSIKGNESEKLAAITDNNARFSPNTLGGSSNQDTYKGLNNAEKERLAQYQKNLNSWESRLNNWQSDLSDRESRGFANNAETNNAKHAENNESGAKTSRTDAQIQLSAADKDKGKQGKGSALPGASANADSPETTVSSDDLASLKIESLKKLGIDSKSAFIIKVFHQKKYYNVFVKTFTYKGKEILVPLLNESNSSLSKIVLESPLFNDYKQLQIDRQKERQAFAQIVQ